MTVVHATVSGRIVHGRGALELLAGELQVLGAKRVLVVTSPSIARGPLMARVKAAIGAIGVETYLDAPPHVPMSAVEDLCAVITRSRPDAIVAVGGGSALDLAKAGALAAAVEAPFAELHRGARGTGSCVGHRALPPIITVPTTLSGAERTGAFSVLGEQRKLNYTEPHVRPAVVIQDPDAIALTPRRVLVESGMNSVAHSVEALLAATLSPFVRPLHLEALRLHARALPRSLVVPDDVENNDALLLASAFASGFGGFNLASGTGIIHALAHAVTGASSAPHGAVYGIVIPVGTRHNAVATPGALGDISEAVSGQRLEGERAIATLVDLRASLGLPASLRELGIDRGDLRRMAELTVVHYGALQNVRPVTTVEAALALLSEAY